MEVRDYLEELLRKEPGSCCRRLIENAVAEYWNTTTKSDEPIPDSGRSTHGHHPERELVTASAGIKVRAASDSPSRWAEV